MTNLSGSFAFPPPLLALPAPLLSPPHATAANATPHASAVTPARQATVLAPMSLSPSEVNSVRLESAEAPVNRRKPGVPPVRGGGAPRAPARGCRAGR